MRSLTWIAFILNITFKFFKLFKLSKKIVCLCEYFQCLFTLAGLENFYSNNYNLNSSEDSLVKVEPESYNSYSGGKISTTVDNSSIKSSKKSFFFLL